jgi:hypothetical protein
MPAARLCGARCIDSHLYSSPAGNIVKRDCLNSLVTQALLPRVAICSYAPPPVGSLVASFRRAQVQPVSVPYVQRPILLALRLAKFLRGFSEQIASPCYPRECSLSPCRLSEILLFCQRHLSRTCLALCPELCPRRMRLRQSHR